MRPLLLAVFTDVLGMCIIIPFLPIFTIQYGIDAFLLGFIISSNAIFGFIFSPILGKLSDRYGRKPCMLFAQSGTLMGFLVFTLSNSIYLLLLARIIDGIFSGQLAISNAVICDVVPPQNRGKQMTTMGGAATFAFIFGPSISGFFYQMYGIFAVGILAMIIASFNILLTAVWLPESHPRRIERKPEVIAQNNQALQANLANNSTAGSPPTQKVERVSSILKNSKTLYILTLFCIVDLAEFIFETTLSLFVFQYHGLSITQIGLVYTSMAIFQVSFRVFLFSPLHKKLGDIKTLIMGGVVYISDFLLMSMNFGFWYVLVLMLYITLGVVFTRGILIGFVSRTVDANSQGKMMGITSSLDSFTQIVGPFIGTFLLMNQTGVFFLLSLVGLSGIAFVMSFRLFRFGFDAKS